MLTDKEKDILDMAEDIIKQKIEDMYGTCKEPELSDCKQLQTLISILGKTIQLRNTAEPTSETQTVTANALEYQSAYTDEHGTKVTTRMETKCANLEEMAEALHFMATSSHRFYLDAAAEIKSKIQPD